jgi:hypothetical protein
MKLYWLIMSLLVVSIVLPACNRNKIACPTYANSFPEKKSKTKPGAQKPQIPKSSKAKSGVLPPGHK